MTRDLTKGSPMGLILSFGIPILFGNLFQQLYNVVDTAIVGKALGGPALAAVGSTGSLSFLVVGFCNGICAGFAIPVAQQFGARNEAQLRRYVAIGVRLAILLCVLLTASTVAFCRPILAAMDTPADIYDRAAWYIGTIFAGLPAFFLYNFTAGVLRALGDSRTPVYWLTAASLLNVALDLLFILVFRLDVFGAALATVLAQAMAGAGCLIRILRGFPILRMSRADWGWDWKNAGELCLAGLPMGLQYSVTAIGSIMIQAAVNGLGTAYVTAITAANKVSCFLCCPFEALGATMATYAGQNVGAEQWDRLKSGMRSGVVLGAAYSVLAFAGVFLSRGMLCMLFLDEESAALLPLSQRYLLSLVAFYIPLALIYIVRFFIQGMGFAPLAILAGVMEMLARGFISRLVPVYGFAAACFNSPAAWIMADLFLLPAFFYCYRRLTRPSLPPRHSFRHHGHAAA